jgi:putative spermidine/putrescine transport system substrate-binding protein
MSRALRLSILAALVAGCGPTVKPPPPPPPTHNPGDPITEIGALEGAVSIVAWIGYIERGDTDPAYNWVTQFEADTGCKVEVKTANTSDEMVALMNEGGYDLVTASGDASLTLIYGQRVQQINTSLIPSWSKVDPRLQSAAWHTLGDKHYGVPYQWGANVLMYNTDLLKQAPTSWDVVFTDMKLGDNQSNKGRIQAYDGPIYIADAALYLKAKNPSLGITDPYELNQTQFNAALDLLRVQHALVDHYWHDAAVQITDFSDRGIAASGSWPYQVNTLQAAGKHIASVIPAEGATGWADTTMMHIDAPHPNCAYKWLEHSLDKKLQGDLAAWFGSVPVVLEACKGNALLTDSGCETNGSANFGKISFWKTPVADCGNGKKDCIPYYQWVTSYVKVLGGG